MNVSKWIEERIYYSNKIDLRFNPIHSKRPIDFEICPYNYINSHKYYSLQELKSNNIFNLFVNIINGGVFFKSSINRRMNNYWSPGLNGGIPMVPKNDEIHETTFMTHDFLHFALPDLIYTGNNSYKHKITYISWRMLSEAITMAIADMFLIDVMKNTGIQYNYAQRRIFPLYEDIGIDLKNTSMEDLINKLKIVIYANYRYCLLGDDQVYKNLLDKKSKSYDNLELFKEKYKNFYVQDYKWTNENYKNMTNNSDNFRYWHSQVKEILDTISDNKLNTIDDIINIIEDENPEIFNFQERVFDFIFNYVFENKIKKFISEHTEFNKEKSLKNAFLRYISGQFMIFSKYNFIDSSDFTSRIKAILAGRITIREIETCRNIYNEFLDLLLNKNLITSDDYKTYMEVYPIFEPSYLSYDVTIDENIRDILQKILLEENTSSNNKYHKFMKILLNNEGYDDIFIFKPNVIIMSKIDIESYDTRITFLIAGISVETAMELVAHGEASVARLTTSKTKSMDDPMYRIFPQLHGNLVDTKIQKDYLLNGIKLRNEYKDKNISGEIFNILNSGSKATALTYTMNLSDLHKLFIGRVGFDGNESEMRDVVKSMIEKLNPIYPNIIKTHKEYLEMTNSEKYKILPTIANIYPDGIYISQLTEECKKIFAELNINNELPEYLQMAEFRSRITYFVFTNARQTLEKSLNYLHKIIIEFGHLSITGAFQLLEINQNKQKFKTFKKIYEENIAAEIKNIIVL
jgi:hypothetical protein